MKKLLIIMIGLLLLIRPCSAREEKRVLVVHSYHPEFEWVAAINRGIKDVFQDQHIELKIFYMNTKREKTERSQQRAAENARNLITSWKPDVLIVADDNAVKYLVVPYYKGTSLPVVFCGVNWDAGVYGLPTNNVTGMIEVTLLPQTIKILKEYAHGDRVAAIASDTLTEHKNMNYYEKLFHVKFNRVEFVQDFEDLKSKFLMLQENADMMIIMEIESVAGFDKGEMKEFARLNTNIPTGSMDTFLAPFSLISCAKRGEEQGEWAARQALRILNGVPPAAIPMAMNKDEKIILNMGIAKELGIKFPMELIDQSVLIK